MPVIVLLGVTGTFCGFSGGMEMGGAFWRDSESNWVAAS